MSNTEIKQEDSVNKTGDRDERGSAIVIAVFVLVLLSVFVALALSRTTSEAAAVGNETSEGRTFYAAQGSLEMMTRNFNKVFEVKLSPSDADFNAVRNGSEPGITGYDFTREVFQTQTSSYNVIKEGTYAGLYATQDNWRLRTTATNLNSNIQVQLTRNILNNRIPIFQFGIFYNDNLEFHPGPPFNFGGRVHSNGSLFMSAGNVLYFNSRVSTAGEIVTDVRRNGSAPGTGQVKIKNGGTDVQLTSAMGSVLQNPVNGTAVFNDLANKPKLYDPDMPVEYTNTAWTTNEGLFGGNLLAHQKSLDLPLKIASNSNSATGPLDYIELIKRGRNYNAAGTDLFNDVTTGTTVPVTTANKDTDVTTSERYYNKTGIRITLADRKAKLPGCASGTGTAAVAGVCGKRLDGDALGDSEADFSAAGTTRGYQPLTMPGSPAYQATRLNGNRFGTSGATAGNARQMWIKVELVSRDATTNAIIAKDVTADILSLGVTEPAPCIQGKFGIQSTPNYYTGTCDAFNSPAPFIDSRSVIKLQRFLMPGVDFITPTASSSYMTSYSGWTTSYAAHNLVQTDAGCLVTFLSCVSQNAPNTPYSGEAGHKKNANIYSLTALTYGTVVPFPIEMFDSREGVYNADNAVLNIGTTYGTKVPWAGVMSIIDVDVANLKKFLDGNFNTMMPVGTNFYASRTPNAVLTSADVSQNSGWVVYVSDRRGDSDFDGEYDMEDIYGNNNGILEKGEDVNSNGILDIGGITSGEAISYSGTNAVEPGRAASVDHSYYRRGVRLINAQTLPGTYDAATASNTRGFTVASENGIYVLGNYNANSIASVGTPTPSSDYGPVGASDVPASIVGDAITLLSNYDSINTTHYGWTDTRSFLYPYDSSSNKRRATETFTRFAMLAGDARSSFYDTPNQGTADARMGGGVHNFKRFLEDWSNVRLNYCGSLINLYNARNNNGSYKSSGIVYSAPDRNWVFDSSFLDPTRLPPGTPYFQYVQTTGFQRTND